MVFKFFVNVTFEIFIMIVLFLIIVQSAYDTNEKQV